MCKTLPKSLVDFWTTQVQDRLKAAQGRIKKTEGTFDLQFKRQGLQFEFSQDTCLLKQKHHHSWKRISEFRVSTTSYSLCPVYNPNYWAYIENEKCDPCSREDTINSDASISIKEFQNSHFNYTQWHKGKCIPHEWKHMKLRQRKESIKRYQTETPGFKITTC